MALQEWIMMCEYSNNVWMYEYGGVMNFVIMNEWTSTDIVVNSK